jgi:hypothetical protein
VKPFLKREMAAFPPTDPARVYRAWLAFQSASGGGALCAACGRALARVEKRGRILRGDLAALGLIALRMVEVKRPEARHLVIDEAQDFSALEFALLRRLAPDATCTAVGDLMQSVGAGGLTTGVSAALREAVRRETDHQLTAAPWRLWRWRKGCFPASPHRA